MVIPIGILVSQDCGHADTAQVIQSYGDQIQYIQQPDQSSIPNIPKKERKFAGYFKIARHYGWALNHTFNRVLLKLDIFFVKCLKRKIKFLHQRILVPESF